MPPDFFDELRALVRADMAAARLSQARYAAAVGCDQRTISAFLTGRYGLSGRMLNAVINRLRRKKLMIRSIALQPKNERENDGTKQPRTD